MLGDYSFPAHIVHPLEAFRTALSEDKEIHAQGCYIMETRGSGNPVFPGDVADNANLTLESPLSTPLDLIDEAVAAANAADVAVVCVGDLSVIFQTGTVGEGSNADSLDLPGVQQQLLEAIVATGNPIVAVLTSGRPYNLGGLESTLAAQVMAFFAGEQGGTVIAHVLAGAVEPGQAARITFTLPVDMLNFTGYESVRIVEPGDVDLMLEASSSNIRLHTLVRVTGTIRKLPRLAY